MSRGSAAFFLIPGFRKEAMRTRLCVASNPVIKIAKKHSEGVRFC